MIRGVFVFLVMVFALALSGPAGAHGRSTSYVTWIVHEGSAVARVRMAALDRTALDAAWAATDPPMDPASALPRPGAGLLRLRMASPMRRAGWKLFCTFDCEERSLLRYRPCAHRLASCARS